MKGTTALLFALLAISAVLAGNNMQLQFGSYVARAVGTSGRFSVICTGGSGNYNYQFSSLPAGWSSNGNVITVPNINAVSGQTFTITLSVRDGRTGEVLNTNLDLSINGVRIAVSQGGAVGGTFGGAAGAAGAGSVTVTTATTTGAFSAPSAAVSALYDTYAGLPAGAQVPTVSRVPYVSPVGQPSIPNPAPAIIATAQAPYVPSRDTNTITVDDVKRTAIFNRQITANKAVANLVSIVQRLTANVNAATNDLTVLTNLLSQAESANQACEGVIYDLSNTKAKIENAIADRETTIADVNGQIAAAKPVLQDLQMQLDKLTAQRNDIEGARSPNAAKLADLENQLSSCQSDVNRLQGDLQGLRDQIANTENSIQITKDGAAAAPGQIAQINSQIPIVDGKIADLKAQLAAAEAQKAQLLADKATAQGVIDQAAKEVTRLQGVLTGLNSQVGPLQRSIADKQANCDRIQAQLNSFRNDLAQIEQNYATLLKEIAAQQALIDSQKNTIAGLQDSISKLPNELNLLRAEHARVDGALNRQYYLCQATADEVRKAKQNAEAMRTRLSNDNRSLQVANQNLEAARAEKALADIAVEEIISVYTSALPFSIVPNGNGLTPAGTPAGNNPSGSPLGAVGGPQSSQVTIGDLNSYLSSAYRAGVDPARPSTVTNLYPLSVTTISSIAGDAAQNLYSFDCAAGSVTGQGAVHSVQPGMIRVDTNSGMVDLQIAGCTNLETTTKGQVLGTGDMVYYRGSPVSGKQGVIQAQSLTCV